MKRSNHKLQRLGALALIGIALLTFPILGLARGEWLGLPAVVLYLFGAWGALIAGAALIAEGKGN